MIQLCSTNIHLTQKEVAVVTGSSIGMRVEVEQAFIALFVMLQEGFSNTFWPSLICYHYWFQDIDSVIVGIIIFVLLTIICN